MSVEIDVQSNVGELARALDGLAMEQLPFAVAKTLTDAAIGARDAVRDVMKQDFTLRRPWVQRGIGIDKATKKRWVAAVGIEENRGFLKDQVIGATRKPKRGRRHLAVPVGVRADERAVVPRSKWPAKLLKKKKFFIQDMPNMPGYRGVWKRRTRRRYPIDLMYILPPKVKVRKRFRFEDTIEVIAPRAFRLSFAANLDKAIETARTKKGPARA